MSLYIVVSTIGETLTPKTVGVNVYSRRRDAYAFVKKQVIDIYGLPYLADFISDKKDMDKQLKDLKHRRQDIVGISKIFYFQIRKLKRG